MRVRQSRERKKHETKQNKKHTQKKWNQDELITPVKTPRKIALEGRKEKVTLNRQKR